MLDLELRVEKLESELEETREGESSAVATMDSAIEKYGERETENENLRRELALAQEALRRIVDIMDDRERFVMMGPRAFAGVEHIAREALARPVFAPEGTRGVAERCGCADALNYGEPAPDCSRCEGSGFVAADPG